MDLYAEWAAIYPPCAHNPLMEVEEASVLSLLPPVAGRLVLDAGCGTGRYVQLLTALGARAIGVDSSIAMVTRARARSRRVVLGDMRALPFASGTCDLVVSGLALMDIADLQAVVDEWSRVLCRRGVVVYSTLHPAGRELGWTRTFERDGETRTLDAHWHSMPDHRRACRRAGLEIERVEEPALQAGGQAVALVMRARKR
jgi:SAM-dependent methyltransferase